jgi:hypothetical protein
MGKVLYFALGCFEKIAWRAKVSDAFNKESHTNCIRTKSFSRFSPSSKKQNAGFDKDKDGKITLAEISSLVMQKYQKGLKRYIG